MSTRLVGSNAAGVSFARRRTVGVVERSAMVPDASVLAFVEVADVRVRSALPREDWPTVIQARPRDPARAGVAIALAEGVRLLGHGYRVGARRGFGIRTRYWLWADVELPGLGRRRIIVGHLPPMRVWKRSRRWAQMMRSYRELCAASPHPVLTYADWNKLARAVRPAAGQPTRMTHIVGWAFTPGQTVTGWRKHVGSDHPGQVLDVTTREARKD